MEDGDSREGRRTVDKHLIHSSTGEKRKGLIGLRDRIQGQSGEEEKEDEGWGGIAKMFRGPSAILRVLSRQSLSSAIKQADVARTCR